ncbi:MAG: hypothetical protein ABSA96_19200 [Candidatus Acidiferrales bacterium]|jgi:hypothetical protein
MQFSLRLSISFALVSSTVVADTNDKQEDRLRNAGTVMSDILKMPDNIPQDLLGKAKGVPEVFSVTNRPVVTRGKYR